MSLAALRLRRRFNPKPDPDQHTQPPSAPIHQSSNQHSYSSIVETPPPSSETAKPQNQDPKFPDLEDDNDGQVQGDFSSIYHSVNRTRKAIAGAIEASDLSPNESEADNPPPNPYPLSQQVLRLEKREQYAQDKCKFLENKCRELTLAMERLAKERDKERSDSEERCKSLEAANDATLKQLDEEKDKLKELKAKNESLAADLVAVSDEKRFLARMLEEKTHESYIFRCAITVIFKLTPSIGERITMRDLLRAVLLYWWDKQQSERGSQESQVRDQNDEGELNESRPQQETSSCVSDAVESDLDSEDLPLSRKRPRAAAQDKKHGHGDQASNGETDEDMPLFDVLRKKTKKLKTMPSSREEASSVA
ncbi:hypothetical protein V8C37DRAFT_256027 [Trichoderma ceciliae]